MRTSIVLILVTILAANADDGSDITTKASERRNTDGTLRWRMETTSRGKTPILRVFQSTKEGVTSTSRSYLIDGDTVMMESDVDGDGFFETVTVYHSSKSDNEVFTQQRDGSVKPVSTQALKAYKKQQTAWTELWDKALGEDMDADKFFDRVQQTQKKIRDAEKEKTGRK
jgi:hypothetical protein